MSHRRFATKDSQRVPRRSTLARHLSITLLCLFYLVSNTAVFPSLYQGKNCRCAEQTKTKSQCCCINKTSKNKKAEAKSCCSSKKTVSRSCCTKQKTQQPATPKTDKPRQISSLCGCGNSAKDGLYFASPRDVNPRPALLTPDSLSIPLVIANASPVTLYRIPDTPPPQQ